MQVLDDYRCDGCKLVSKEAPPAKDGEGTSADDGAAHVPTLCASSRTPAAELRCALGESAALRALVERLLADDLLWVELNEL